jgi:hypothetical protein
MNYRAVIIDTIGYLPPEALVVLRKLARDGRLIVNAASRLASEIQGALIYHDAEGLLAAIDKTSTPDLNLDPGSESIRYRHVEKGGDHYYILFNEEAVDVTTRVNIPVPGTWQWIDPSDAVGSEAKASEPVLFKPHELKILRITSRK